MNGAGIGNLSVGNNLNTLLPHLKQFRERFKTGSEMIRYCLKKHDLIAKELALMDKLYDWLYFNNNLTHKEIKSLEKEIKDKRKLGARKKGIKVFGSKEKSTLMKALDILIGEEK